METQIGRFWTRIHDLGHRKEPILQMVYDKIITTHVYDKPFTIRLPDGSEWKKGFQPDRKGGLIWYTDGSKTKKKALELGCIATEQGGNLVLALAIHNSIPGGSICHQGMCSRESS
jgi:hypothetical protein